MGQQGGGGGLIQHPPQPDALLRHVQQGKHRRVQVQPPLGCQAEQGGGDKDLGQRGQIEHRLQPRAAAVTPGPHSLAVKDGKGSLGKAPLVLKMLQQPGEAFV